MRTSLQLFLLLVNIVLSVPLDSSNYDRPTIIVKNQCNSTLNVGYSKDVDYYGKMSRVAAGNTQTIYPPVEWSGRVWARTGCSGDRCLETGMGSSPASLAEFHFLDSGSSFYDISFVAGYNLPMVIEPASKSKEGDVNGRMCKTASCKKTPPCPSGWETLDTNGNVVGCQSACTKFNTDEYCCTGAYNGQNLCHANKYTDQVKSFCPDVYSYAYDDDTKQLASLNTKPSKSWAFVRKQEN
ncbi:thaumatin [Sporodiniella umbellata]|nr:thaumatin [Sporodiniella umbellata]